MVSPSPKKKRPKSPQTALRAPPFPPLSPAKMKQPTSLVRPRSAQPFSKNYQHPPTKTTDHCTRPCPVQQLSCTRPVVPEPRRQVSRQSRRHAHAHGAVEDASAVDRAANPQSTQSSELGG